jgi:hypothetical protein
MSKRTTFTTVTALPSGVTRQSVIESLYDHVAMIDLNPLVEERHPVKPPADASAEEYHCRWYQLTDKIHYLPGGLYSGRVTYSACFHNLADGLQTHVYAPMGLNIMGKWTVGGSLPGEPRKPVELGFGMPMTGLWLREDVNMRCNILMTNFVKKTLKKAHVRLVERLLVKAQLSEVKAYNTRLRTQMPYLPLDLPTSPESQPAMSTVMESVGQSSEVHVNRPELDVLPIARRRDFKPLSLSSSSSMSDGQIHGYFPKQYIVHSRHIDPIFELEA